MPGIVELGLVVLGLVVLGVLLCGVVVCGLVVVVVVVVELVLDCGIVVAPGLAVVPTCPLEVVVVPVLWPEVCMFIASSPPLT